MKRSVGKGATFGFAMAIVTLLASGWLSYRNLSRLHGNETLVIHTHEVLDELRNILGALAIAETSRRYLLTAEPSYLAPYRSAAASVQGHVSQVRRLLGRVFDAFSQEEHDRGHRFGGLGLGLAITQRLVELLDGKIVAESEGRGCGATFRIELPLALADPVFDAVPSALAPAVVPSVARRILLVEDHEQTRSTLEATFATSWP